MMKNDVKTIRDLELSIRKYRLEVEIEKVRDLIDKKKPQYIDDEENIFSKFKKNVSNKMNDKSFNSNLDNHEKLFNLLDEINHINDLNVYKEKVSLIPFNELSSVVASVFSEDTFDLAKLEFAMNVILDNCYNFTSNDKTFDEISLLLGEEANYLNNINKEMKDAYVSISLDKSRNLNDAMIVGGLLTLVLGGPALGVAASLASEGITLLTGAIITSIAASSLSYVCLNKLDKSFLKKEFKKLNVEEMTISLVKTILEIIQIKKFKYEEDAKILYETLVEQYIDLKSDVDISLFLDEDDVLNNSKKNEVFAKADKFLKKKCFNL